MLILLMTRPKAAAQRFVTRLPGHMRAQVTPLYSPLIAIEPVVQGIEFGDAQGLVFTSANAVETVAALTDLRDLPCYCVGQRTTTAAGQAGWRARFCGENAAALIRNMPGTPPGGPLLHLRGVHARGDVAARLTHAGYVTREQVVYDQPLQGFSDAARRALDADTPVIAPLFSPRTARQFGNLGAGRAPLYLAALSEAVEDEVKALKFNRLSVAQHPDATAMAKVVGQLIKDAKRVEGARPAQ